MFTGAFTLWEWAAPFSVSNVCNDASKASWSQQSAQLGDRLPIAMTATSTSHRGWRLSLVRRATSVRRGLRALVWPSTSPGVRRRRHRRSRRHRRTGSGTGDRPGSTNSTVRWSEPRSGLDPRGRMCVARLRVTALRGRSHRVMASRRYHLATQWSGVVSLAQPLQRSRFLCRQRQRSCPFPPPRRFSDGSGVTTSSQSESASFIAPLACRRARKSSSYAWVGSARTI